MSLQKKDSAPGFYPCKIGNIELICISDGILLSNINAVIGVSIEKARALFDESFFPQDVCCSSNNYIIRSQGRTALVDTGAGPFIYSSSGKMIDNIAAAGISLSAIDTVLLTHLHPDHISGLMDNNWKKVFPNAVLKIHEAEFQFWLSENPPAQKIAHVKHEADHVIKFMTPYLNQIEIFTEGEVFPGVYTNALPGHTPGHTGYLIRSQGEELLIWGDIVHWPIVQFTLPDAAMIYDVDPVEATATRWKIFTKAASTGLIVAGMHLWFPGFTRIRRKDDAFVMAPIPWDQPLFS